VDLGRIAAMGLRGDLHVTSLEGSVKPVAEITKAASASDCFLRGKIP
jgi:hypothetical protein